MCLIIWLIPGYVLIVAGWAEHAACAEGFVDEALGCEDLILLADVKAADLTVCILGIMRPNRVLHARRTTSLHGVGRHDVGAGNLLEFVFIYIHLYLIELLGVLIGWHAASGSSEQHTLNEAGIWSDQVKCYFIVEEFLFRMPSLTSCLYEMATRAV